MAAVLRKQGYLVSSLRHEFGAGDLLAVSPNGHRDLLVEVKGTLDPPWRSTWGPKERQLMRVAESRWDVEPILAWWPPHLVGGPIWVPQEDWPA